MADGKQHSRKANHFTLASGGSEHALQFQFTYKDGWFLLRKSQVSIGEMCHQKEANTCS